MEHNNSNVVRSTAKENTNLTKTVSKNVALSLARVAINSIVALALPAYLTQHLPAETYGAWVLILQLGAFVSFLDFGVQTAISKFVAEHDARGNEIEAGRYASAGFAIMALTGFLGVLLSLGMAWQVPRLFHAMPTGLYHDVQISVILVGSSLSFSLVCSVFSAVFLGLQRYAIPMGIAVLNKTFFAVVVVIAVFCHSSLASMGMVVAIVNVSTSLLQLIACRRMAPHIRISLSLVDSHVLKQMVNYCFLLAIWTVGMVCVSGLDVTIVGHFAYHETAYYSIATLPTSFLLLIISSILGPLMPASSSLSTRRSASEMGAVLAKITRYSTLLLLLTGLPLIVFSFPILRIWVGPAYASQCSTYLKILVLANIIRNLCAPYATMIVGTGQIKAATASPVLEAIVNLACSIYFASRFGAIGVAYGTLLGSFTSIFLHFMVSMHYTRQTLTISRNRLFMVGILRPLFIAIPSVLLFLWYSFSPFTISERILVAFWLTTTLLLTWFGIMDRTERSKLSHLISRRTIPHEA